MKTLTKNLFASLSILLISLMFTGIQKVSAADNPDYSGRWEISFFDASGKLFGIRSISIDSDGSISDKINLDLDKVIYLTEISAVVSDKGKVKEGKLTDTYKIENVGILTGNFTESEGKGEWKNYYGKNGTWSAKRSDKKDRQD